MGEVREGRGSGRMGRGRREKRKDEGKGEQEMEARRLGWVAEEGKRREKR